MSSGVYYLKEATDVTQVGGKAANLAKMLQAGLPVPDGLAVGLGAFGEAGKLKDLATQEIVGNLKKDKLYAVRSSALAEDAEGASWAGQFETFLNTKPINVVGKVEECHNSAKARAIAYADEKAAGGDFNVAVVVQEMIAPEYAGVMFTKDPVQGRDVVVVEYVKGLGEQLVGGTVTPENFEWDRQSKKFNVPESDVPFNAQTLLNLGLAVETLYRAPQDIEWVVSGGDFYLVQTRPITTLSESLGAKKSDEEAYFLGKPEELFYWGPSRAKPMYMSDFMAAAEQFFVQLSKDPVMPNPPKTLVLFHNNKMVWLSNAKDFSAFTAAMFSTYEKRNSLEEDIANWQKIVSKLDKTKGDAPELVEAWKHTLSAEFSLYGAESAVARKLVRFDPKVRQEIWGAFTVPDNLTFLAGIDQELLESGDPELLAKKYPWIDDGYRGVAKNEEQYFIDRLKMLRSNSDSGVEIKKDRNLLAKQLGLSADEVNALNLVRRLAEFMDQRKAWMMRTRRYITKSAGEIEHGWLFAIGEISAISAKDCAELWERFVEFKASTSAVTGIVASNGGRHFINGKVKVVVSPTDVVGDDLILVVTATSPSYVPLMRAARALVTDHGGMMSHAAIVAREFNLPCIVGTKQATKVLKDGDKVVLDLVKGTISK